MVALQNALGGRGGRGGPGVRGVPFTNLAGGADLLVRCDWEMLMGSDEGGGCVSCFLPFQLEDHKRIRKLRIETKDDQRCAPFP